MKPAQVNNGKKLACSVCSREFSAKSSLSRHLSSVHHLYKYTNTNNNEMGFATDVAAASGQNILAHLVSANPSPSTGRDTAAITAGLSTVLTHTNPSPMQQLQTKPVETVHDNHTPAVQLQEKISRVETYDDIWGNSEEDELFLNINYDEGPPVKTEPLRISLCELCNGYVNQNNYKQHFESTSHKISLCFKNDNILFNFVKSKKDCILNCRFSQKQSTIIDFFNSINMKMLDLVNRAIELQNNEMISLDTKIFILYQENKRSEQLGIVKTFSTKRETLTKDTDLSNWLNNLTYTLNVFSQEHLKSLAMQMFHFDSVVFFDIYFSEVNDSQIV